MPCRQSWYDADATRATQVKGRYASQSAPVRSIGHAQLYRLVVELRHWTRSMRRWIVFYTTQTPNTKHDTE